MNEILTTFFEDKIKKFKNDFLNISKQAFKDSLKKNGIIHPGEYGEYREKIVLDFISIFLPQHLSLGAGFLITSNNKHSSQTDIVIYGQESFPKFEYMNDITFYPVESVCGIGEIKSTLNRENFLEALKKLSETKKMCDDIDSSGGFSYRYKNISDEFFNRNLYFCDQVFSFLICEKLNFDFKKMMINEDLDKFYIKEKIENRHRHNLILSVDDGVLILYSSNKDKEWLYPINYDGTFDNVKSILVCGKKESLYSIKTFFYYLMILSSITTIIKCDMSSYVLDDPRLNSSAYEIISNKNA